MAESRTTTTPADRLRAERAAAGLPRKIADKSVLRRVSRVVCAR